MHNIAYVFPGQGSQTIGMLSELADNYPLVTDTFKEVSDRLGFDVWQLCQKGPESSLNQTENTQVAMLTADIAVYRVLQSKQFAKPFCMAGHSLGEYAALVAAEAISLADAAALVQQRGRLMQQNVPLGQGAMAAIVGLKDEQVRELCEQATDASHIVTPANFNAVGQVVIAGHTAAVAQAIKLADEAGARMAVTIPVSVPCHCPLLADAAQAFAEPLATAPFRTPQTAVISNVDLSVYESVPQIKALLQQQLCQPVRWVETIMLIKERQAEMIIESGPGKVLSGLVKRIDRSIKAQSVNDLTTLEQAENALSLA